MDMPGQKSAPTRGQRLDLPEWWIEELRTVFAGRSGETISELVHKATGRKYARETINRFLGGPPRTYELMDALLKTFPDLPSPVRVIESPDELDAWQQVDAMARDRGGSSAAVRVPDWWIEALARECSDRTPAQLALQLSAFAGTTFTEDDVVGFLAGTATTAAMVAAFLVVIPEFPPAEYLARSYEEAIRLHRVARSFDPKVAPKLREPTPVPRLLETIENYDDDADDTADAPPSRPSAKPVRRTK